MKQKAIGWGLVGLGVVAVGYLGWYLYHETSFFSPWYDIVPALLKYPIHINFWLRTVIPLVAGVLLLVFGIRMIRITLRGDSKA